MVLSHKEFYGLIIDNMDAGIALIDYKLNPCVFNPTFEQYCRLIDGSCSKESFSIPSKLLDLLTKFQNEWPPKEISLSQVKCTNNKEVFITIKNIRYRSQQFYLVTIHLKVLRKSDLYLTLKEKHNITEPEYQVILLAKKGFTNEEIAETRDSSPSAVKMLLSRIYKKLEVANRAEMIGCLEDIVSETIK